MDSNRMRLNLLLVLLSLTFAIRGEAAAPRPNVLLIMADDLGFSDLGCYGSEIATPNFDSLATSGLRFSQFYNTGRCWPTRGSLLTGYYAQQIRRDKLPGLPAGNRGQRPEWAQLLPRLLKSAGYRSYHTGKWHIDGMPLENGFDRSYLLRDQGRFFNPQRHWKDDVALPPVEKGTDFYATTALADHAIECLKEHAAGYPERPFFHYLAFAAPHFPLHAPPEDIALYASAYSEGWEVVRERRWRRMGELGVLETAAVRAPSRTEPNLGPPYHFPEAFEVLGPGEINRPSRWTSLSDVQQRFQATKMAIHAAMIHRMDIEIGRVFAQIKAMGAWENTLIVFLSDNGASAEIMVRDDGHDPTLPPGAADTYLCLGPGWSTTCNTPFRRHKTWTHEGGVATPLLMAWPAGIATRGEVRHSVGHVVDVVPTILELAGGRLSAGAPSSPGQSMVPLFQSDSRDVERTLWWFHDGHRAIRSGDWKAVSPIGEPWELYDLSRDRGEESDLAIAHAATLQRLTSRWEAMLDSFRQLASRDLPPDVVERAIQRSATSGRMNQAQQLALPRRTQVLPQGETLRIKDRHAFVLVPDDSTGKGRPWIFYGPTLPAYPDQAESWMHQKFLDAGVAVAGIDVGESYGSPHAFPFFEALYQEMERRGFSPRPAMLGRSRGGLWVSSWAVEHPDRVAGIGGIYPVYDFTTYPGLDRAAPAYGLEVAALAREQRKYNPIERAVTLAEARIPVFIIHGRDDRVVPLPANSGKLREIYETHGVGNQLTLIEIDGQGHSFWPGYFTNQQLVDFLIARAHAGAEMD